MNRVLLRKWLFLLVMLVPVFSLAQQISIRGKVTSQAGNDPIIAATVKLKGTAIAVQTNLEGAYTIQAPIGSTLVFSYIGYISRETKVTGSNMSVTLASSTKELNELVVTAQGIKRQARSVGFSVASIDSKEINQAKVTDVTTGLSGKVSGLQINLADNGINPQTRVVLRGNRSLLGNNQALIVVDNVQVTSDYISTINPNDIENVTILKGANASATYGSDGVNGVLVITTKKGSGKPSLSYSLTQQYETLSYVPPQNTQFGSYGGEAAGVNNGSVGPYPSTDRNGFGLYQPFENQSFGPAYNGRQVPLGQPVQVKNADGSTSIKTLMVPYSYHGKGVRDWFNNAYTTQHDLSYSVGTKDNSLYVSLQNIAKTGVVPNERLDRTAVRLNGFRKTGIVSIDYNGSYSRVFTKNIGNDFYQSRSYYFNALQTPGHVPVNLVRNLNSPYGDVNGFYSAYATNPAWQANNSFINRKTDRFLGSLALTVAPKPWLTFTGRIGFQGTYEQESDTHNAVTFTNYAKNTYLSSFTGSVPRQTIAAPSSSGDSSYLAYRVTADFLANYNKKFGDYSINLTLGANLKDNNYKQFQLGAPSLVISNFFNISNVNGTPQYNEGMFQNRLIGAFTDLSLGYKNYLFLHGSLRKDYNSLLSKSNQSYYYPEGDVSFVLTDAIDALKDNHILSYAKISGSLSKVYQVSILPYELVNPYRLGLGFPFGGQVGYEESQTAYDSKIKPEQTLSREIDLELGFFDNRINFKGAYYKQNTRDQTVPIGISPATGFTGTQINTGEVENHGLEFDLSATPVISLHNGFRWNLGANISFSQNKVISLYQGLNELVIPNNLGSNGTVFDAGTSGTDYADVGSPFPILKGSDWNRDNKGRVIIDPNTGDPTVNKTLQKFGQANPTVRLGLNTSVNFKGFTLAGVAEYRGGNVLLNAVGGSLDFGGSTAHSTTNGRQRFVWPNSVIKNPDGTFTPNKNITVQDGNWYFWNSVGNQVASTYVTSGAFWRLRELSLTYEVPVKWLQYTRLIKRATVGIMGRNLLLWRPKANNFTDPEFSDDPSNAVGYTTTNQTPPTRIYGFNLNVTF